MPNATEKSRWGLSYLQTNLIMSFFLKKTQWMASQCNTLWMRIFPLSPHTHTLTYTYRASIKSYMIRLLPPLQPQLHHCSSCSLMLDFFPILRWGPVVHSKDCQTSMGIRTICISNKFPEDVGAASLWTILLSIKTLKNVLFPSPSYLLLILQVSI